MPPEQDESDGRSTATGTDAAAGVHEHPKRIELRASGWNGPIGWCGSLSMQRRKKEEGACLLQWARFDISELHLSKPAALLVLQGMRLNNLFPPDLVFTIDGVTQEYPSVSPYVLLRAEPPNPLQPPPKLRAVVLGVVIQSEGFSEDEIRSAMLADALSP